MHFYINYQCLNVITKNNTYLLSYIDDTLNQLQGATIFLLLNLVNGLWQVPQSNVVKEKTVLLYQYNLF